MEDVAIEQSGDERGDRGRGGEGGERGEGEKMIEKMCTRMTALQDKAYNQPTPNKAHHSPSQRHTVCPIKDIGVCVMPCPPHILDAENIERDIKQEIHEGHRKGLAPPGEPKANSCRVGGIVETRICRDTKNA